MPNTLGYHLIKTTFGTWLPGDPRGHWSALFNHHERYVNRHQLNPGDQNTLDRARRLMTQPPVTLTPRMISAVAQTLGHLIKSSGGGLAIHAAAIEPAHVHLLIPYAGRDIHKTAQWIADRVTKRLHADGHEGKVWTRGKWAVYLFDQRHWDATRAYIRRHNTRRGLPPDPYPWIGA
jgi:REP element-mobilizing transposase RayT